VLWILLCWCAAGVSQGMVDAEYFFDQDPGAGKGTPVSITPGNTVNLQLTAAVNALSPGFHTLAIRFRNSEGRWSLLQYRSLYIMGAPADMPGLQAAEYFIDQDPGPGKGVALASLPSGSSSAMMATIPTESLAPGFHVLAIRVKDASGNWSHFASRTFYLSALSNTIHQIVAAEYFVDTDPGVGKATVIQVPSPVNPLSGNFACATPQGLSAGQHFLYIRVKDDQERWSNWSLDTFMVDNTLPVTGMQLAGYGKPDGNLMEWHTLTENNSSHFEVERSDNGTQFYPIGKISASGNSQQRIRYAYTDKQWKLPTHFYRLKQVDRDGAVAYSNIITVIRQDGRHGLRLYPNPARGSLLQFETGMAEGPFIVSMFDAGGRLVSNVKTLQRQLNIAGLQPGQYFITISNGHQQWQASFLRQ
ncbi:MAG: T9SS type A sorting domain-containing protein, partial [Chitinophagaceae bacterium]|nr:T9SS type A sorting domain-containing protein [Chitinophagaceae bacterium]